MTLLVKTPLPRLLWWRTARMPPGFAFLLLRAHQQDIFNIVWALVFGFATLNILSMAARQHENARRRLNFGELLAIIILFVAIGLLAWEMLNLFHVFPLKLQL
jgi:hypothetical protein